MIKDPTDPSSVADGLLRMITTENKLELGKAARKTVKDNFVLEQQAQKYIQCFQQFMKA